MKLDGMKCPYCSGKNTHAYQMEKAVLWDDSFYKTMEKEFGENRFLYSSCENAIYRCKCNDCERYFSSMVKMNVEVTEIISMENTNELMSLKMRQERKM